GGHGDQHQQGDGDGDQLQNDHDVLLVRWAPPARLTQECGKTPGQRIGRAVMTTWSPRPVVPRPNGRGGPGGGPPRDREAWAVTEGTGGGMWPGHLGRSRK